MSTRAADLNLDSEVAEKVMGWKRGVRYGNGNGEWIRPGEKSTGFHLTWEHTPRFSRDDAAAFAIVQELIQRDFAFHLVYEDCERPYMATFTASNGREFVEEARSAAHAITLAALAAVEAGAQGTKNNGGAA